MCSNVPTKQKPKKLSYQYIVLMCAYLHLHLNNTATPLAILILNNIVIYIIIYYIANDLHEKLSVKHEKMNGMPKKTSYYLQGKYIIHIFAT